MGTHHGYNFGDGATTTGSQILPVSAFSAYNLLRNCNYFLSAPDPHLKNLRHPDLQLNLPPEETSKGFSQYHNKLLFPASTVLGYPPARIGSDEPLGSPTSESSLSHPLYGSSNLRRQRGEKKPVPEEQKDDKYFERRRRNNQAAKKSRDARKIREDQRDGSPNRSKLQIALKATILEHENAILRAQVLTLREEASSLRQMLLQKKALELVSRDTPLCIT